MSKHGNSVQNYHYEDLIRLVDMYHEMDLVNPACVVDANHSNSNKQFAQQIRIVREVMMSRQFSTDIKHLVKGVMIESYIEEGCQKISDHQAYGKSITDPCLGWAESEKLIYSIRRNEQIIPQKISLAAYFLYIMHRLTVKCQKL